MSHFAHITNNIVDQVIVAEQDFIDSLPDPQNWIQTSYNTRAGVHYDPDTGQPDGGEALRGNYAGVGYVYDSVNDVFYPQQPFPSWTISGPSWVWTAPVPRPSDKNNYIWSEDQQNWIVNN